MGGNSSSRHVSLDEADEVTFVKGIRLSERVINRMKESPPVVRPQAPTRSSSTPPVESSVPDEHHVPIMPHSPSYASALVPPLSEPSVTEETSTPPSSVQGLPIPPPTGTEHVVVPDPQPGSANIPVPDPQPAKPIHAPSSEPIPSPPLVESTIALVEPFIPPPVTTSTSEPVTNPPSPTTDPLTEPVTSLESSNEPIETPVPSPADLVTSPFPISTPDPVLSVIEESTVLPSGSAASDVVLLSKTPSPEKPPVVPSLIDQVEVFPHQTHVVNEEKLRKEIREGLQKLLNEEMKMAERNMRQRLEVEKAEAKAQAQAAARLQIQDEVQKVLDQEKPSYQQTLADAIRSEQLNAQEDRLITQYYWMERKAQKLEEKQKDLENQESLFQKQIAKMQEKAAQFTKITAEHHRKGLEDANSRFRRYQIKPVCLDLQSQIMKCYSENKGQTMSCSNIASLYIQCVDRAKQDKKLSTGG
ncbi:coiled-coil-helix-coiled-coil-helix domain containing 3b [Pimephales promelas]|uniref:coiled-coil-helix-coiled-coil-helix domain containing 3b n=1 Tax=Pimephales promelas TaxID=90988 RepID=UPI001955B820|nr:coiled-coil-helix-coiled-coil-helix domain containing 3b [Pimephales promelas]XP_039517837.1 coiled-coil-helix-coiled-coil-helix domain containing 3b [Pimephales promelas]XP_039517838.1 coiled-coil-helix-coiled-coil-helix domain containing 3b [Pimephales promelas]KAG1957598.1 MICOS complex subunit Mic19 [Pimephales promelas]